MLIQPWPEAYLKEDFRFDNTSNNSDGLSWKSGREEEHGPSHNWLQGYKIHVEQKA